MKNAMRKARIDAGMTLTELAKRSGVNITTIVSWESGRRVPGIAYAWPVCDVLGITLDKYVGRRHKNATDRR